jgi:hypothetical protein
MNKAHNILLSYTINTIVIRSNEIDELKEHLVSIMMVLFYRSNRRRHFLQYGSKGWLSVITRDEIIKEGQKLG